MPNRRGDTGPYSPPSQPGACCSQVGVFRISIRRQSRLTSSSRCASGVRAGIRPFGGSTTSDVRGPAGFAELNTAL